MNGTVQKEEQVEDKSQAIPGAIPKTDIPQSPTPLAKSIAGENMDIKSNPINDAIKNFGLERFTGMFMGNFVD